MRSERLILYGIIFAWPKTVWRQSAHLHTQAESGAYTGFLPSSAVASIYLFKPAIRHRVSPLFMGSSRNWVPMAFTAESPPAQGQ